MTAAAAAPAALVGWASTGAAAEAASCGAAPQLAAAGCAAGEAEAGRGGATGEAVAPLGAAASGTHHAYACGVWEGSHAAAAAAAAVFTGHSISMADLLQQLQSDPSLGLHAWATGGTCIRKMELTAACFDGVSLHEIPASLLLTCYIAEVGDRAQQCMSAGAVGQQGAAHAGHVAGAECLAVVQEVEGLLQLSVHPVLLQVLGGQRLQELFGGLMSCKQLLSAAGVTL